MDRPVDVVIAAHRGRQKPMGGHNSGGVTGISVSPSGSVEISAYLPIGSFCAVLCFPVLLQFCWYVCLVSLTVLRQNFNWRFVVVRRPSQSERLGYLKNILGARITKFDTGIHTDPVYSGSNHEKLSKMHIPTALGLIVRERFKGGSRNLTWLRATITLTTYRIWRHLLLPVGYKMQLNAV